MLAGLALAHLASGCSSDPPGGARAHAGNAATAGGAGSSGGAGQVAGGGGGQPMGGDVPDTMRPIAPAFNPTPPVPLTSRWSGSIVAEYSENYTFRIAATAPVRALVDGEQILRDTRRG